MCTCIHALMHTCEVVYFCIKLNGVTSTRWAGELKGRIWKVFVDGYLEVNEPTRQTCVFGLFFISDTPYGAVRP